MGSYFSLSAATANDTTTSLLNIHLTPSSKTTKPYIILRLDLTPETTNQILKLCEENKQQKDPQFPHKIVQLVYDEVLSLEIVEAYVLSPSEPEKKQ
jgi:hypothetical protein